MSAPPIIEHPVVGVEKVTVPEPLPPLVTSGREVPKVPLKDVMANPVCGINATALVGSEVAVALPPALDTVTTTSR